MDLLEGLDLKQLNAASIVHELIEARDEKRLLRLQRQLAAYRLLIVDELGFSQLASSVLTSGHSARTALTAL